MILEKAILHIYPDAKPNRDFFVMDDGSGPEIKKWKYSQPVPTETELQAAWEEIKTLPPQLTPTEQLQKDQADLMLQLVMKGVL